LDTTRHARERGATDIRGGGIGIAAVFKHSVIWAQIRSQRDRETERLVSLKMLDPVILYILGGGLIILALGMAAIDS
jgi:hypothetical protein